MSEARRRLDEIAAEMERRFGKTAEQALKEFAQMLYEEQVKWERRSRR